ncbi:MAG: helix-turn-helix domain-containing protein [Comamonadaceae bacterium]|nr:MAG: helix-turn-helix domain-containing protein [Comamonadaceae bacterium]
MRGIGPNAWLIRARLERGRRLLLTTDASVAEVSDRVGFKDVAHFSRSFRTQYGTGPSRYRDQTPAMDPV